MNGSGAHMTKHAACALHMQMPAVQRFVSVALQAWPQLPQSVIALVVSTQFPEQHEVVAEHVRPHAPQFAAVVSDEQTPPQHD